MFAVLVATCGDLGIPGGATYPPDTTGLTPPFDYGTEVNMTCTTGRPTPYLVTRVCTHNVITDMYELQGDYVDCPGLAAYIFIWLLTARKWFKP